MSRCGVHQGGEYKRINTVSSISNRGEAGSDEGKRREVHHEWGLEREGGKPFDGSTVGRGGKE